MLLYRYGIVPIKYYGQMFGNHVVKNNFNYSWVLLSVMLLIISSVLFCRYKENSLYRTMFYYSFALLCSMPFASMFINLGRLVLYFLYFSYLFCPLMGYAFSGKIKNSYKMCSLASVFWGVIYWCYVVGINDYTGTINYLFFWQ